MFEFTHDCEELEAWFYERWLRLQAGLGRDLNHIQHNNHKHKVAVRPLESQSQKSYPSISVLF